MIEEILNTFPESTIEHRLIKALVSFFHSLDWVILFSFLKTLSFLISLFLFGIIIFFIFKLEVLKGKIEKMAVFLKKPVPSRLNKKFNAEFNRVKKRLAVNKPEDDRLALIEAEELLRQGLETIGIKGQPFSELIRQLGVWRGVGSAELLQAHQLRNQAVHYAAPLSHSEVVAAVEIYEKALRELGLLS